MIIEMTYAEWQDIYAVIGRIQIGTLSANEFDALSAFRERVTDYRFDN